MTRHLSINFAQLILIQRKSRDKEVETTDKAYEIWKGNGLVTPKFSHEKSPSEHLVGNFQFIDPKCACIMPLLVTGDHNVR